MPDSGQHWKAAALTLAICMPVLGLAYPMHAPSLTGTRSRVQAAASAVLAPSLRYVADSLALSWRRQLTDAAHARYLARNNFYTVAQLAGLQARLPCLDGRLTHGLCTGPWTTPSPVKMCHDVGAPHHP